MPKRSSRGRLDLNQLAKSIVDQATDEEAKKQEQAEQPEKNPAAVALGRLGGKKGGKARAEKLTPEERKEIARKAAKARWNKVSTLQDAYEDDISHEIEKIYLPPADTT